MEQVLIEFMQGLFAGFILTTFIVCVISIIILICGYIGGNKR